MDWVVGKTYISNHPTRSWETSIISGPGFGGPGLIGSSCGASREEAESIARLIAAAPDLLEVVKELEGHWHESGFSGPDDPKAEATFTDDTRAIWRKMIAAINKAEGRS